MSIQQDIEQALIDRVKSITPFVPVLPVNFHNVSYDPPVDNSRFIETNHLPNPPANYAWGGSGAHYTGTFRVAVIDPLKLGTIEVLAICDAIVDHFADGVKMVSGGAVVFVNGEPSVQPMLFDPDRQVAIFPVSIDYNCNG